MRLILALLLVGLLLGCGSGDTSSTSTSGGTTGTEAPRGGKLKVVSTVGMIHDAVVAIGGEYVEAEALMGPGVDPHLYKATARDTQRLSDADVVFYIGLDLEGRLADLLEARAERGKTTIPVSEDIANSILLPAQDKIADPHIWHDPLVWGYAVERVAQTLVEAMPEHADGLLDNRDAYTTAMRQVDEEAEAMLGEIPESRRVLVTAHDAFQYFGKRYGLEVVGIQGTSTATEASAASIRELTDLLVEHRIPAIFVESSVPKNTIEALQKAARARGHEVKVGRELFSDAMGAEGTPEGTYVGMIRHNATAIAEALK